MSVHFFKSFAFSDNIDLRNPYYFTRWFVSFAEWFNYERHRVSRLNTERKLKLSQSVIKSLKLQIADSMQIDNRCIKAFNLKTITLSLILPWGGLTCQLAFQKVQMLLIMLRKFFFVIAPIVILRETGDKDWVDLLKNQCREHYQAYYFLVSDNLRELLSSWFLLPGFFCIYT